MIMRVGCLGGIDWPTNIQHTPFSPPFPPFRRLVAICFGAPIIFLVLKGIDTRRSRCSRLRLTRLQQYKPPNGRLLVLGGITTVGCRTACPMFPFQAKISPEEHLAGGNGSPAMEAELHSCSVAPPTHRRRLVNNSSICTYMHTYIDPTRTSLVVIETLAALLA